MIVKMMKYDIVLLSAEYDRFIETLRETGMVDITSSGWEPSDNDRQLLSEIDGRAKALAALSSLAASKGYSPSGRRADEGKAYEAYVAVQAEIAQVKSDMSRYGKVVDEWGPWGDFSVSDMAKLSDAGVHLRYFVTQKSTYDKNAEEWGGRYNIALISEEDSQARFVVIDDGLSEVSVDAQELKAPSMGVADARSGIEKCEERLRELDGEMAACADSREEIARELSALKMKMQNVRIESTAGSAADGMLMVMEGWVEESNCDRMDAVLDAYPNVVYIKSKPTPEDNTPVKLKNNRFARVFELIGSLYALPKYGTLDLTPFFAPFYMLFFAICLNDAGYGLILLLAGLLLLKKGGEKLRRAAWLTVICGGATALFGFYSNAFFGLSISSVPMFKGFHFLNFQQDFFSMSLVLGIVQIMLGMLINICMTTRLFGFRYALGSLGWFLLILSCCLASGLSMLNGAWVIPGFTMGSPAFLAVAGLSLVLMLFFNSPGKNIFANFGSGLWNTYNNITGLLSDVLSYIRLFAIGLSGGVLALVFNSLAIGITGLDGDLSASPWWAIVLQVVGASVILLIGHGINLFMSTISSLVHPMRLTFVEFYKNAGFEMGTRAFEPLRNDDK